MDSTVVRALAGLSCLTWGGRALAAPCLPVESEVFFLEQVKLGPIRGVTSLGSQECYFEILARFAPNSSRLTEPAKRKIDALAAVLLDPALALPDFILEGHTDARGSEVSNQALSLQRAKAVLNYLESKGVSPAKFAVEGLGESSPLKDHPFSPENRRVQIRIAEE